jgi:hypothetical protein
MLNFKLSRNQFTFIANDNEPWMKSIELTFNVIHFTPSSAESDFLFGLMSGQTRLQLRSSFRSEPKKKRSCLIMIRTHS